MKGRIGGIGMEWGLKETLLCIWWITFQAEIWHLRSSQPGEEPSENLGQIVLPWEFMTVPNTLTNMKHYHFIVNSVPIC